jgi:hypothetical protein
MSFTEDQVWLPKGHAMINPSFPVLEKISRELSKAHPEASKENKEWSTSEFNWLRALPPGRKGAIGRYFVHSLFRDYGLTSFGRKQLVVVNSQVISVKTSLMWGGGNIRFQNIRNTPYDFVLCLGIYPKKAFGWLIPKPELWMDGTIREDRPGVTKQHKGADAWIEINPDKPPTWLKAYGGTSDDLIKKARRML